MSREEEILKKLNRQDAVLIRRIEIDKKNERWDKLKEHAKEMKHTPTFAHLDDIAKRKRERERNQQLKRRL